MFPSSMASLLRPHRTYHLYATRCDSRPLFAKRRARVQFWNRYLTHVHPSVDTYAYCLLPRRVHLLVRVASSQGLSCDGVFDEGTVTWRRRDVFSDNYAAHIVQGIHHSPVRLGLVSNAEDYPFSSYRTLATRRPTRLRRGEVHGWFSGADGFVQAHRRRWSGMVPFPETPDLDAVKLAVAGSEPGDLTSRTGV